MSECLYESLAEITDRALVRFGVEKKKYFSRYLVLAEEGWEDIFKNTLWCIKSVWMPTKAGSLYNYIQMPPDCQRLLSVGTDDKCGLIQPLYYNQQINVVAKPTTKKCGCSCPDCGGLCESVNSMVATSKLMFTINGVPYYQKCWLKYCANGDILQYCDTPAKKFNNLTGDAGDFNSDYNDDYDIESAPFSDYTIEYIKTQTKICKLETEVCGCPKQTESNEALFFDCCGFWVNWNCREKRKRCNQFSPNINNNYYGECKVSECGTKIIYRPSHHWKQVATKEIPDYLLVNYQTTGTSAGAETLCPKYARNVLYAYLDNGRKEYNSAYSQGEKNAANEKLIDEKSKLTAFLSPINLIELSGIQDVKISW